MDLLKFRRDQIDENVLVLAGIYLDPRVHKSLTNDQKIAAKEVVENIFSRIDELVVVDQSSASVLSQLGTASEASSSDGEPPTKFGRFVKSLNPSESPMSQTSHSVTTALIQYERTHFGEEINYMTDPTIFWLKLTKNRDTAIKTLAETALKIITCPLTEVTSERLFSMLNFVFNDLRCSMKNDLVEDILFCKWNSKVFEKIQLKSK